MNIIDTLGDFYFGSFVYKQHSTFGPRIQSHLQIFYVFEGCADIQTDRGPLHTEAGEAVLLCPSLHEHFQFSAKEDTRHGYCTAHQGIPEYVPEELMQKAMTPVPFSKSMTALHEAGELFTQQGEPHIKSALEYTGRAIFGNLLNDIGFQSVSTTPYPPSLERAVQFIQTSCTLPLTLSELADHAGISSTHLIRLFKKHLDKTPMHYVWETRLKQAAHLLKNTGLSISEIAYKTGFQTPYHFSRRFTSQHSISPKQYRKRSWEAKT